MKIVEHSACFLGKKRNIFAALRSYPTITRDKPIEARGKREGKEEGGREGECFAAVRSLPVPPIHRFLYCPLYFLPVSDRGIGNCKFVYCRRRRVSKKKRTSQGKDWGNAINPKERIERCRTVFSFPIKPSGGSPLILGSFFPAFVSEGRRTGKLLARYGRMIFNELKARLSCSSAGKRLARKELFPQKSSIASKNLDVRSSETFGCSRIWRSISFRMGRTFRACHNVTAFAL